MSRPRPWRTIQRRSAENRAPCLVARCTKPRHGASRYCSAHKQRLANFGHPEARKLLVKHYEGERKEVARFLKDHASHPGIRNALEWIAEWLAESAEGDKSLPGYVQLARLHRFNVTPEAILHEVASIWLYVHRNPTALPDGDGLSLTHALAIGVLFLVPHERTKTYQYRSGPRRVYRTSTPTEREGRGGTPPQDSRALAREHDTGNRRAAPRTSQHGGRRSLSRSLAPTLSNPLAITFCIAQLGEARARTVSAGAVQHE